MSRERPNDLSAFWLPFTPNRDFKAAPRMLARAEGMYFHDENGRALLDACSGLWCSNAGHGRKQIADAIAKAAHELDFAPTFQFAHPQAFELAQRIAALAPEGLDHVFFVNSGSEAADAALKIARAYWQKRGQGGRFRLIGREKAYHGVTIGGISVGGLANNRRPYGPLLPGTDDHLPLPYDASMRFTRGEPENGANYADALDGLVALHGAETIAAVIVEPMSGSAGVFAPPKDYLKRLRAACDRHNVLLIFDEVITGFGRLGAAFAAERHGVVPDMITFAKGVTNGAVPMGGVIASNAVHDAFMQGPAHAIELFHGHTYSAHPLACAAGLATLDLYRDEDLFARAAKMMPVFEEAVHSLKSAPRVIDIRNCGLAAGIDIEPDPAAPGLRGYDAMRRAFFDENMVIRVSGDTIALAPALIATESDIASMVDGVRAVLSAHRISGLMKPKREIEKCLQAALIKRGWRFERVEDLRRVFVKGDILTPYFWPAVTGRNTGWYSIDGYIGILDREFEAVWRASHTSRNFFPLMMHSANFAEIRSYTVEPPEIEFGVEQFATAFESFVSHWPRNRAELGHAFAENKLLGKDIELFGSIAATLEGAAISPKLSEFRSFLENSQ